jgi:hypothetical protein
MRRRPSYSPLRKPGVIPTLLCAFILLWAASIPAADTSPRTILKTGDAAFAQFTLNFDVVPFHKKTDQISRGPGSGIQSSLVPRFLDHGVARYDERAVVIAGTLPSCLVYSQTVASDL